jgi:branched-chain amino acid transport system ATP-binding protein
VTSPDDEAAVAANGRRIGEVILDLQNISLSFGGVKALTDISFDVREHEIRAIIGPNGAGKSSMLNVINGVYHPQKGRSSIAASRAGHGSQRIARQGIARTFQNIALFKGMTVLDNIMTGRNTKMRSGLFCNALWWGAARNEEIEHRARSRRSSTSSKSSTSARPRWAACPTACKSAWSWRGRWRPSRTCCCWTSRWPA